MCHRTDGSILFYLVLVVYYSESADIPYSQKIWWGFKFGGLAVGVETAKLKSANIMLAVPAMRKT